MTSDAATTMEGNNPERPAAAAPIYLDHNATTPCDARVVDAMLPYFTGHFGNAASATHDYGSAASAAVETARYEVARLIGAEDKAIVFTSGATESINLAIAGCARFHVERGRHLVSVATEHRAALDCLDALTAEGWQVDLVGVDSDGIVDPGRIAAAIRPDTVLVSAMAANNEIGTLHDLAAIGRVCKARGVFLHCDAAQAAGKEPLDVEAMGIDLLSLSAHKLYGPKGVGALYVRRRDPRVRLTPLMHGGGHERGLRPGTLNVPGIVGFGRACVIAQAEMADERTRLLVLKERLWNALSAQLPGLRRLGHPQRCLAGTLNVVMPGVVAKSLLCATPGVAASIGAACSSLAPKPSHVLRAIGLDWRQAEGAVRFSLGRWTTAAQVDCAAERVLASIAGQRAMTTEGGDRP